MTRLATAVAVASALALCAPRLLAQWPAFPNGPEPKTADGKQDLAAPAPRTADGKPDLSDNSKDNPDAHCLPMGVMQLDAHPFPKKIIQTPKEVLLIYEGSGTTVREVFLDGRALPKDRDPWWNGYSVGHWEGDTLVVETSGFMDDGWLDVRGSPFTSAGTLTERIRRLNYGYLEIAVTIDDPKAYTKPFTAVVYSRIMPAAQLTEFVCIDKDAGHYVGSAKK